MSNKIINYDEIIENSSNPSEYFGKKYPNIYANLDKNNKFNDVYFQPSKKIVCMPKVEKK